MNETLTEGREFSGAARELSTGRILAFSGGPLASAGWPAKNLHTDAAKAAEAGLNAPIASGIQCEGDIIRLLIGIFGEKTWFRSGRLHVKYPRLVFAGTHLVARARVRALRRGDPGTFVELDVWCETSEKETVVVGTASCTAP